MSISNLNSLLEDIFLVFRPYCQAFLSLLDLPELPILAIFKINLDYINNNRDNFKLGINYNHLILLAYWPLQA